MLARFKARFETDLADPELQDVLNQVNEEILNKWGAHSAAGSPITVQLVGFDLAIFVHRPIAVITSVTEVVGTTSTVLAANDYRLWFDGRALSRLNDGTNPAVRWGDRVTIVYVPEDDNNQRQEVILKVAMLDLQYRGVRTESIGDYQASYGGFTNASSFSAERNRLINSLRPKGRMGLS